MSPIRSSHPPGASTLGRLALMPLLVLGSAACAASGPALPAAPPPDAVPELERRVQADPGNADLLRQLGAAERAAGMPEAAAGHLEAAAELEPGTPSVHFFLALAYEDLERPGDAIEAYRAYQARVDEPSHEDEVEARVRVLQREQLRQAIRARLSEEGVQGEPSGSTVAVFPFLFGGGDESLRPLSRALAAMLVTDLSQTDRLRVLERLNVQALIDEISLAESGLVDPSTAARSGYLLGAGSIVQGRIEGDLEQLSMDAAVVRVTDPETGETVPLSLSDATDELFAMEKQLALGIYEELGISLTAAERERVTQRRTESLQAILAYGRGLEAADRGDFAQAATFFREAASHDPDFEAAQEGAAEAEAMAAVDVSTDEFETMGVDQMAMSGPPGPGGPTIPDFAIPADVDLRDPVLELIDADRPLPAPAILIITTGGGGDR